MARLKAEPEKPLATLEDAEAALGRLCRIEAEIQIAEGVGKRRAAKLAEDTAERLKPLQDEQAELVRQLTTYADDHRELFPGKKKSLKLTHGELGVRKLIGKLEPIAATKHQAQAVEAAAIEVLEGIHPECVKVVRKLDLTALRKAGDEVWHAVGYAVVGEREQPFCKTAPAVVQDLADKLKPKEV